MSALDCVWQAVFSNKTSYAAFLFLSAAQAIEVDARGRLWRARAQWIAAHLALDPARHLPASRTRHALLQDLAQHLLMQGEPVLREGKAASSGSLRRTTRMACRNGNRSAPSAARSAAWCMRPRTAKCASSGPQNSWRTRSGVLLRSTTCAPRR